MTKILSFLLAILFCGTALAQTKTETNAAGKTKTATEAEKSTNKILSGPMLGHVTHREASIWLEVSPKTNIVELRYRKKGESEDKNEGKNREKVKDDGGNATTPTTIRYEGKLHQIYNPIELQVADLDMNTEYIGEIWLDGQKTGAPLSFRTKEVWEWRKPAPDFSFFAGSCSFFNDPPYDRPGKPYGQDSSIFETMNQMPSDFMLWLGDNVYLREADYSSASGIRYRYSHDRQTPILQPFLASRPHYAIWDDHDFGPNDSNMSFPLRDVATQTFNDYWANPAPAAPDGKGVYTQFSWSDADFFLLDNRYFRTSHRLSDKDPEKTYLGKTQMQWLKNALLTSRAAFKFVVSGSQILNPLNDFECMTQYKREYDELLNFIVEQRVEGVVFLSGDRHYSEVIKITPPNAYPLYDITSSPLTSGVYRKVAEGKEGQNDKRVEGTLLAEQNFIKISAKGEKENRTLQVVAFDKKGKQQWAINIDAQSLKFKQQTNIATMKRVTSLGGVFFKCQDPSQMRDWYRQHLGLKTNEYGTTFEWRQADNPQQKGFTVWSPFDKNTNYFEPSTKDFMLNFRVEDLDQLLLLLKQEGIEQIGETQIYEYGKFAYIMDPEGNKIELWQPYDEEYGKIEGETTK